MLFGLVMSQEVFRQKMDMILEGCPGTLGLKDYIIVYGKTKEHNRNQHNLTKVSHVEEWDSEKCKINQKKIHFFWAIYDKNRVRPDSKKVEIIMLPSPKSIIDLQRVFGIITYMAPLIPHLSDLTSGLLKNESEYRRTEIHQKTWFVNKYCYCTLILKKKLWSRWTNHLET